MAQWKQIITEANKVTDLTAPTSDFSMNSNKITNVTDPAADQDAATKKYVDDNVSSLDTEAIQDIVGAMFSGNTETNISATYEDGDGTIDLVGEIGATDIAGFKTEEQIQDIVGAMFSSNTETRISATYQDGDGTIDLVVDDMTANTQLTTEEVQDIVGGMFSSNTETNCTVSYQDSDGTIDVVVSNNDVSVANLKSALAGPFGSNQVTIGSSNDVVTIGQNLIVTGDLQVSGSMITTSTETLEIADNTMILNSDKSGSADVDAGIIVERGDDGDNALLFWDEGVDRWKVGTNDNANLTTTPTITADVGLIEISGSYTNNSTAVPIGHLQYHNGSLYVRVED